MCSSAKCFQLMHLLTFASLFIICLLAWDWDDESFCSFRSVLTFSCTTLSFTNTLSASKKISRSGATPPTLSESKCFKLLRCRCKKRQNSFHGKNPESARKNLAKIFGRNMWKICWKNINGGNKRIQIVARKFSACDKFIVVYWLDHFNICIS